MTFIRFARPHRAQRRLLPALALSALVLACMAGGDAESQERPEPSPFIPEATIVEIMDAMVMPPAQVLWDAVSFTSTAEGIKEEKPETDEDWTRLRWSAVTLAEASNALLIRGRHVAPAGVVSQNPDVELGPEEIGELIERDWPAWVAYAHVLHDAAMESMRAIDARNADALSEAGGPIDAACEGCHLQFWYPPQRP